MKIDSDVLVFRDQVFGDVTLCHSVMGPLTLEDEGKTEFHRYLLGPNGPALFIRISGWTNKSRYQI